MDTVDPFSKAILDADPDLDTVTAAVLHRSTWDVQEDKAVLCVDGEVADLLAIDHVSMDIALAVIDLTGKEFAVRYPKRLRRFAS